MNDKAIFSLTPSFSHSACLFLINPVAFCINIFIHEDVFFNPKNTALAWPSAKYAGLRSLVQNSP